MARMVINLFPHKKELDPEIATSIIIFTADDEAQVAYMQEHRNFNKRKIVPTLICIFRDSAL